MSKNIKLSATRINSFLSCKQKYWFNYYDKLPKVSNPSFKLGLAVHESLEMAGNIWMEKSKLDKEDIDNIIKKYNEVSVREGIYGYDVHTEGYELVKKRLQNFIAGRKILALEKRFGFEGKNSDTEIITDLGVPLMGAIDKIEEYNDDTIIVVDYKTSKTAPTPIQMKTDIQLSIYDIVVRKLFPDYKRVVLSEDLLKSEILYTYRTDEERIEFNKYLKEIYDSMLRLKAEEVKASLNMFCPWCDYKDYCSTYQNACKKSDYTFLSTMHYTNEQLVEEWNSVKATKKILESRERELSMTIIEKIKLNSANLKCNDTEVYIRQNSSTNYDLQTVLKAVPTEDFPMMVNLNKKAVEEYMDMNPSVKEAIKESSTTNYTSPFLATRKSK